MNATLVGALSLKLLAATSCARQMLLPATTAPYAQFEPAVESQFQTVTAPLLATSGALYIHQALMVTNATRAAFEAGAAAAAAHTVNPTAAALETFGINYITGVSSSVPPQRTPDKHSFLLPVTHITPLIPELAPYIMYDLLGSSEPWIINRREAFLAAITTGNPAWTDLLPNVPMLDPAGLAVGVAAGTPAPASTLAVPVLAPGSDGGWAGTIGTCALAFDWSTVLRQVLPSFVTSVTAVLTSFSGRQATYALQDGVVSLVGLGDLHDARFDRYARTASADVHGAWSIDLYPTDALLKTYTTSALMRNAVIIAVVVTLCAALFAYYELSVRQRASAMNVLLRRNLAELGRMKAEEAEAQRRLMEAGVKQQNQFVSMVVARDPHAAERRARRNRDAAGDVAADERAARAAGAAGRGCKPRGAHRGGQCVPACTLLLTRTSHSLRRRAAHPQSCCTVRARAADAGVDCAGAGVGHGFIPAPAARQAVDHQLHARCRGKRAGAHPGRFNAAAAGAVESAVQLRQVHARGRAHHAHRGCAAPRAARRGCHGAAARGVAALLRAGHGRGAGRRRVLLHRAQTATWADTLARAFYICR